jgi:hypothetical protein
LPNTRSNRPQEALLACLQLHSGSVVPYKRLCRILGYKSVRPKELHLLRQYITLVKKTLAARRTSYVVAVAHSVGYALCRVAPTR